MRHSILHCRVSTVRRGIATLEFAMALPILLLLMVGITWLGFSVVTQTEVLVQARDKAWKRRFDNPKQQPLLFPAGLVVAKNPLYSYSDDYVSESATKPVDVSPIFKMAPAPKASHTILSGSWDHRALDMNSPPNFKLYVRAGANAVTGDIQTQLGKLTNFVDQLQQIGATAIAQAITQRDESTAEANNSKSAGDAGDSAAKQKKEQDKEAIEKQQQQLGGVVDPNPIGNHEIIPTDGGQLDQTNDEIDRLQQELDSKEKALPDKDQDKEKQRQAEIERIQRRIQLLKDRKQRIEAEIRDNTEELQAYD